MSGRQPKDWTPERHEACKAREKAATRGPWKWWTSNSHRRLTAEDCQDGGVAYGTSQRDGCGDIVINEADMAFTEHAREDVLDMLAKIESLAADVDFYKRREQDICDALGGVGDGGKYRNDIIDVIRARLRPEGPLTEGVKRDIHKAFANLCGSGVPEDHLARMHADHAIGLLENQRPEWFTKEPKR